MFCRKSSNLRANLLVIFGDFCFKDEDGIPKAMKLVRNHEVKGAITSSGRMIILLVGLNARWLLSALSTASIYSFNPDVRTF